MQKLPESKYLEPESGPPQLGAIFPGVGAGARTIGTLTLGPEPEPGTECFLGAGPVAVRSLSGSAFLLLSIQYRPCGLEYSRPLGTP